MGLAQSRHARRPTDRKVPNDTAEFTFHGQATEDVLRSRDLLAHPLLSVLRDTVTQA
jgi:hypothetical protein